MKALESEIVALQDLVALTGNEDHIESILKNEILADLLELTAQGALVRSRF